MCHGRSSDWYSDFDVTLVMVAYLMPDFGLSILIDLYNDHERYNVLSALGHRRETTLVRRLNQPDIGSAVL